MITEVKPDDKDAILKDLRLTSFWQGSRVWRQRMNLYREYWRDKVPTCLIFPFTSGSFLLFFFTLIWALQLHVPREGAFVGFKG